MIQSKEEFIRSFLPDEVENIELTQILVLGRTEEI